MSYITNKDYLIEVAKGNVAGAALVNKFGRNLAVGTTFEPLTQGGIYQMPQPASATTLRVKSGGNANDTAAGTGAREVTFNGLDETGAEVTEAVATAGASASSATTATFMRLFRAWVSSSGTYASTTTGSHSADIVIENGAGGTDWATIDSTNYPRSQSEIGCYSVPLAKTAYMLSAAAFTDTTKITTLILMQRQSILDAAAPYEAMRQVDDFRVEGGEITMDLRGAIKFPACTDIVWLAKVDSTTAEVDVEFELLLVDD